jgi:hypothetical protein
MTVPIIDQLRNTRRNDCGCAAAVMLAGAVDPSVVTYSNVDALSKRFDIPDDGTGPADLLAMGAALGVKFKYAADVAYPYITLIDQTKMPKANQWRPVAGIAHWVVRIDAETYHDPYWPDKRGANMKALRSVIDLAEMAARKFVSRLPLPCRVGLASAPPVVIPPQTLTGVTSMTKAKSRGVNMRTQPIKLKPDNSPQDMREGELTRIRWINAGDIVDVSKVVNGWANIDLANNGRVIATGVALASLLDPVTAPPPENPTKPVPVPASGNMIGKHPALPRLPFHQLFGLHMLTDGKPMLQEYMDAGCKSFTVMNNVAAAREARAAGCAVIYRRFIDHGVVPDPFDFVRGMGLHKSDQVMVMGINEADNISTSDLVRRFDWDRRFAEAVWALYPECFPLIGSFSMGTPQLENPEVARVWRDTYGKFLNDNWQRVGLNYHSYSGRPSKEFPPANADVVDPEWFEMRHLKYAYDPFFGALDRRVILTSDESGVDIGSIGGFPAAGYNGDSMLRWWQYRRALFEPNDQQYVFNAFQAVPNERWAGYNVRGYVGTLSRIWRGEIPVQRSFALLASQFVGGGESPLPADWSPAPKDYR